MPTTVATILERAYAKSMKNAPDRLLADATEGVNIVNVSLRALFCIGARVNVFFFATEEEIAFGSGGWGRPAAAESVFHMEHEGEPVITVPFDDRAAEPTRKAVYRFGQVYRSAGNPGDPTSGTLTFYYSRHPAAAGAPADSLDAMWPTAFDPLLEHEVAIHVALKDGGREEEVAILRDGRDRWLRLFLAHLEHETINEYRRFGTVRYAPSDSVVPLASLLAGGTSVTL